MPETQAKLFLKKYSKAAAVRSLVQGMKSQKAEVAEALKNIKKGFFLIFF